MSNLLSVADYVSGSVEVTVGGGPRGVVSANGTYTFTQTAQTNTTFYIVSSSFVGALDSVIVQESGQVGCVWVLLSMVLLLRLQLM